MRIFYRINKTRPKVGLYFLIRDDLVELFHRLKLGDEINLFVKFMNLIQKLGNHFSSWQIYRQLKSLSLFTNICVNFLLFFFLSKLKIKFVILGNWKFIGDMSTSSNFAIFCKDIGFREFHYCQPAQREKYQEFCTWAVMQCWKLVITTSS